MLPASQRVPERGLCYREPELRKWYCHNVYVLGRGVVRGQGKKRGAKKEKREKKKKRKKDSVLNRTV